MRNIKEIMRELAEYSTMQEELKLQIESLQDEVKQYMTDNGVDEVLGDGGERATWKGISSKRVDANLLKAEYNDIYNKVLRISEYKRFTFKA